MHNVFNGLTAHGFVPSKPYALQLPNDPGVLQGLQEAVDTLSRSVSGLLDTDDTLTALIRKLDAYCAKQGWREGESMRAHLPSLLPSLGDALREKPQALTGKAGIAGILNAHAQRSAQAASALRRELAQDTSESTPPRFVLSSGQSTLVELLTPRHLKEESAHLKHCVGTTYNENALKTAGLKEGDAGAEQYLHYAIKLRKGESRIFSLRSGNGQPLATIEYDVAKKRIEQIEGNPRKIKPDVPFFADLCGALHELKGRIDLSRGFDNLPSEKDKVLMRDGRLIDFASDVAIKDILNGGVFLNDDMDQEIIDSLCSYPNLVLNITALSQKGLNRLPETVCADIVYEGRVSMAIPNLKISGNLDLSSATDVSLPALKSAEDMRMDSAKSITLPALQSARYMNMVNAKNISLPALQSAGDMSMYSAKKISLPALQSAEHMYMGSAKNISLPALQSARYLNMVNAKNISLPALQSARYLNMVNAKNISLLALQAANELHFDSATNVYCPKLERAKVIYLNDKIDPKNVDLSSLREGTIFLGKKFYSLKQFREMQLVALRPVRRFFEIRF